MSDDVVGRRAFPPDPGLVRALGANHSLPTALADLVDNSVDAGATTVLVRFLNRGAALEEIHVVDDGHGMDSEGIGRAMTLGARRDYSAAELGHFGVGLKAAALSAAGTTRLFSQRRGATPVGLELERERFSKDYSCGELAADVAAAAEQQRAALLGGASGTSVRLSELVSRYHGRSAGEAHAWLAGQVHAVRSHLGVVFHRLLAAGRITLLTEEGALEGSRGLPTTVQPVDPFGYRTSGRSSYPRMLRTAVDGRQVPLHCHIWPARQTGPEFRLNGTDPKDLQGFYVYRGDRLLSVGGWLDGTHKSSDRMLARVVVEYEDVAEHLTMNPEKSRIVFRPTLAKAVHSATDGDVDWARYLEDAETALKAAKRRERNRKPSVGLDKGFDPDLRRAFADELEVDESYDPVSVKWRRLPAEEFFEVDFPARTVWLNQCHRDLLAGADKRGINDAPVLKALVYLLTRHVFMGQYPGSKDKDDIALWQQVLSAAVQAEARRAQETT